MSENTPVPTTISDPLPPTENLGRIRGRVFLRTRVESLLSEAALLAKTYGLTHKDHFGQLAVQAFQKVSFEFDSKLAAEEAAASIKVAT